MRTILLVITLAYLMVGLTNAEVLRELETSTPEQFNRLMDEPKVNINTADAQKLDVALKGIGPSKAKAIVDYRQKHGRFTSIDELLEVKGIGKKLLDRNQGIIEIH